MNDRKKALNTLKEIKLLILTAYGYVNQYLIVKENKLWLI